MKKMNLIGICLAATAWASAGDAFAADDFPKWPLTNGDFSTCHGHLGLPRGWDPATESGKHNFKLDPPLPVWGTPAVAIIETIEAGSAYYHQTSKLMEGDYLFTVEVRGTEGAKAQARLDSGGQSATSGLVSIGRDWSTLQFGASVGSGAATVVLAAEGADGQQVEFRNVALHIKRLHASAIPLSSGLRIGGIVLPRKPTLAEQFACYELQRHVFMMTGLVPGLKGRDQVFDGKEVTIGQAASKELRSLKKLPSDSYVTRSQGNEIFLVGNTDSGTLYAVYDFLRQQGCRWVVPGALGEIVPTRTTLLLPRTKTETPDYECRGISQSLQEFFPGGGEEAGWDYPNLDEYFDWLLRNRMNSTGFGTGKGYDFGAHRGHGWVQLHGHSYGGHVAPRNKYFKERPEWYPLVRGERMALFDINSNYPNQLCVSNQDLRDYTVDVVLDYFKNNPGARAFPLNPSDWGYWCECDECKKLDPPGIDWSEHSTNAAVAGMTDRALHYANEVAERVAKVYPDKHIEMYGYGCTLEPPKLYKVHRNVFIKYAYLGNWGTGPLGLSMMDPEDPVWGRWRRILDGWHKEAGAKMAYYNYLEFAHPDVTVFWFYSNSDVLRNLNRHYGFRILQGETPNNVKVSTVLFHIIFRTVWDVDTDYKQVIRDTCDDFYGPVADDLYAYNLMMDEAIQASEAYRDWDNYVTWQHVDIPMDTLEHGRSMLEAAADKVKTDPVLTRRLAYARFGHAYLTYVATLHRTTKTPEIRDISRRAFDLANTIRTDHHIMARGPSVRQLATFYYPPVESDAETVAQLPETWDFKKDPLDAGLEEEWFEKNSDDSWVKISTSKAWTSQEQGREYHGVAWYHTAFELPATAGQYEKLMLHFGAVDGHADFYLDGVKIGEQKADVNVMWDKPFQIPLPVELGPVEVRHLMVSDVHHLMVRVRKDSFAAGIWKSVKIVGE